MNMDRMIILLLKLDNIIRNRNTTIFSRDFKPLHAHDAPRGALLFYPAGVTAPVAVFQSKAPASVSTRQVGISRAGSDWASRA